jgi:rRNA biogenesis protein RRP5
MQATAPASTLELNAGFDWTGAAAESEQSESEDDSEDDTAAITSQSKSKSKGKTRAVEDLTATAPDAQPESTADFERALLASPNSSFLWIQYMSFLLQLHEIDKARKLGRQALEKIAYREEEEKLNVWMALVNLELGFGTEESAEKTFKEAAQYNDARTVYTRYADALAAAGKDEVSDEVSAALRVLLSCADEC